MKKFLTGISAFLLSLPVLAEDNPTVLMNTQTLIYHVSSCIWAKKCTRNCIETTKDHALEEGARACKVCGE